MHFLTKFATALVLPAFVPAEPFPRLTAVTYTADTASAWQSCLAPRVIDGDTIRCGTERVRLTGIDAPELHGCPKHRKCVAGEGNASPSGTEAGALSGASGIHDLEAGSIRTRDFGCHCRPPESLVLANSAAAG